MSIFIEDKLQKGSKVGIICPICKKKGNISVPNNILKNHGVTTISIPKDSLCEHNFQFFLDRHLSIQVYKGSDYGINLKNIELMGEDETQNYYIVGTEDYKSTSAHPIFETFLIFNSINNWIMELVSPSQDNIMELIDQINNEIHKVNKENELLPEYLNALIWEEVFHFWSIDNNLICLNLKKGQKIFWIQTIFRNMINKIETEADLIAKILRILLLSDFLDSSSLNEKDLAIADRLIFDELLYSKIELESNDMIPKIIKKIVQLVHIDPEYLISYFNTELSTIEFLRSTKSTDSLEKLLKVVDFVKRRKLLKKTEY